jgi:hypothetical protein
MLRERKIHCDAPGCVRGVVAGPKPFTDEWATPCHVCLGYGSLSLESLCKRIGECPSTVAKLFKPHRKMRAKVAARITGKLCDLLSPPPVKPVKQQEMFA